MKAQRTSPAIRLIALLFWSVCFGVGAASQDPAELQTAEGISVPGAFSPETAELQAIDVRSGEMAADAMFREIKVIREQLHSLIVSLEADVLEKRLKESTDDPRVIGVGIDVPEYDRVTAAPPGFTAFDAADGGTLLALRIHSPGALGIRLGLLIEHLPSEVRFIFAGPDDGELVAPSVTGEAITTVIERNAAAGDLSDEGRTYWSPTVEGEEVVVLIHVPDGVDPDEVRFSIPRISHIFRDPLTGESGGMLQSLGTTQAAAAWCNNDATCYPGRSAESSAVAHMQYTANGTSFICTGTLLNDKDPTGFIPYFLTANHCISTQTVASTLQTHWYLQSAACDSDVRDARYAILYGGAQLLYANAATDVAFMRLNEPPPGNPFYLGWSTVDPVLSDDVTGIHHPQGDWKKISFGDFGGFLNCWSTSGTLFDCEPASSGSGDYLRVDWYSGTTEEGSSGSALLDTSGRVIGTLRGGDHSCSNPLGYSEYGRFSVAYEDGLKDWLDPPPEIYTVTPSAGSGGTVSPSAPQTVNAGQAKSFTVTANSGYARDNAVGGTCPQGNWHRSIWTTGAINANCTVSFSFTPIASNDYTVTPSAGAGGSVSPNVPQQVSAGAKKSFTVTANVGYTPSKTVDGTCPKGGWTGNTWTTAPINANCTVGFSFHQVAKFNDVPPTYWASQHILSIADAGITTGCGPSRYCPENHVTRAEMAAFLLRGMHGGGYTPPSPTGTRFGDVARSFWAASWIEDLAREGITTGCGGGRYCPNNSVTRAEMAVFLLRSKYGSSYTPPAASGARFRDVSKSHWAASWIEKLAADGVTTGCGGGNYCPENSVTRAEMAVFLARTFNLPLPPRP